MIATLLISQIIFITPVQIIEKNSVSSPFTIQIQNHLGEKIKAGETMDLNLETTSLTGQFSSSPKNWIYDNSLVMGNSFSSRTFYYKDTIPGEYTITARLISRKNKREWVALQEVRIKPVFSIDHKSDNVVSVSVSQNKSATNKPTVKVIPATTPLVIENDLTYSKQENRTSFTKIWSFICRLFF